MEKELLRSEQKKENTWNLESVYSSKDEYQKDYDIVTKSIKELQTY